MRWLPLIDVAVSVVVVSSGVIAIRVRVGTVAAESVERGRVPGRIVAEAEEVLLGSFLILSLLSENEDGQGDQNQKAL